MWANKTGSIHLQVMCTAHPAENVNYVFKGRQGALVAFGTKQWGEGRPREGMLNSFSDFSCQLSVWLWEGRGFLKGNCDVYSSGDRCHPCCSDDDSKGTLFVHVLFFVPLLETLSKSSPGPKYSVSSATWLFPWPLSSLIYSRWFNVLSRRILRCTVNILMSIVFDLVIPLWGISPWKFSFKKMKNIVHAQAYVQ